MINNNNFILYFQHVYSYLRDSVLIIFANLNYSPPSFNIFYTNLITLFCLLFHQSINVKFIFTPFGICNLPVVFYIIRYNFV